MDLIDPAKTAARARAAAAYSGLEHAEIVARAKAVKRDALPRILSKTNPRGASREEREALADACGVPRWFMEEGFATPSVASLEERIEGLEASVKRLLDEADARAVEQAVKEGARADAGKRQRRSDRHIAGSGDTKSKTRGAA